MKSTVLSLALITATLSLPATATTLDYGVPLSGTGPTTQFATLSYSQIGDGDDWVFVLAAADLSSVFSASGAFIGSIAVDAPGAEGANYAGGLALTNVVGGVATVEARNGGGPGGAFDFRIVLGAGADRLTGNESVGWTWMDSGYASFTQLALHVQGLSGNTGGNSDSVWYLPTPVPEPGTVLLMLAGCAALAGRVWRRTAAGG